MAIPREAFENELRALRMNTAYIARREQEARAEIATATGALSDRFVAEVLTNRINSAVIDREARRRRLRVTEKDRKWANDYGPVSAGNPQIFSAFPEWYQQLLWDRAANVSALHRVLRAASSPEEYYAAHGDEFVKSCARHLLVRTREDAAAARTRILSGESFAAVARDVSLDSGTGPKGGDIGCNGRGDLAPGLDDATFAQPMGKVGPPIETAEGFSLVLVTSRATPPQNRISGEVEVALHASGTKGLEDLVRRRLKAADVTVSHEYGRWDAQTLRVVPA